MTKLLFTLSHSSIVALGLPFVREHKFCPCCGESVPSQNRLAVFVVIEGVIHGPVCESCARRWVPTLWDAVIDDRFGRGRSMLYNTPLISDMSRTDEKVGYRLLPI